MDVLNYSTEIFVLDEKPLIFQIPFYDRKIYCTLTRPGGIHNIYFHTESPWDVVFSIARPTLEKKFTITTISELEHTYKDFLALLEKEIENSELYFSMFHP